ncbi:HEAT repeat domain-containing protein, partial [bacterium AH-315-D21]|nr:HEAT repeat domain-containing protein [bacterium AH-315-D21]
LLDDEQATVALLEVVVLIAEPGCEEIAQRLSSHPSSRIRELCAELFVRLGGDDATTTLVQMLDDDSYVVRKASAKALGDLQHWPAATRMAELLDEARWPVRIEAALSLAKFGAPGILFLRREVAKNGPGAGAAKMALDTLAIQAVSAVAA